MSKSSFWKNPILMICLGAVVMGGGIWASNGAPLPKFGSPTSKYASLKPTVRVASVPGAGNSGNLGEMNATFSDLAEAVAPAVVTVTEDPSRGGGSGWVYRSDGWIVTNDHVVGNAKTITVIFADGREVEGKVYRTNDALIDLALVKVDRTDLTALQLTDSSQVRVGEYAMAIGAPFGLQNTVTIGHVSALGRGSNVNDPNYGIRGYAGMIQTDAAINPGNSGGPLVNINGELIGVNSTIVSSTMSSAGIGFALPANMVRAVADEIIATGKFDRGLIGAAIEDVKPYILQEQNLKGGAIVTQIPNNSPSYAAGLRKDDIITRLNGEQLHGELELRIALMEKSPNETVELTYVRDGKVREAKVKLTTPEPVAQAQPQPQLGNPFGDNGFNPFEQDRGEGFGQQDPAPNQRVVLGVQVRAIDDTVRQQFDLPSDVKGAAIMTISPGSLAESLGLKVGDVIVEINGDEITQLQDVTTSLQKSLRSGNVSVVAMRNVDGKMNRFQSQSPIR
ncbi:MAG: trypsin-like peptidase domain-containing protein [Armatimonadetes bacterium]|nr:trypsin-like peptidase domain-containing protein [Armatimonadota bacterium]